MSGANKLRFNGERRGFPRRQCTRNPKPLKPRRTKHIQLRGLWSSAAFTDRQEDPITGATQAMKCTVSRWGSQWAISPVHWKEGVCLGFLAPLFNLLVMCEGIKVIQLHTLCGYWSSFAILVNDVPVIVLSLSSFTLSTSAHPSHIIIIIPADSSRA